MMCGPSRSSRLPTGLGGSIASPVNGAAAPLTNGNSHPVGDRIEIEPADGSASANHPVLGSRRRFRVDGARCCARARSWSSLLSSDTRCLTAENFRRPSRELYRFTSQASRWDWLRSCRPCPRARCGAGARSRSLICWACLACTASIALINGNSDVLVGVDRVVVVRSRAP